MKTESYPSKALGVGKQPIELHSPENVVGYDGRRNKEGGEAEDEQYIFWRQHADVLLLSGLALRLVASVGPAESPGENLLGAAVGPSRELRAVLECSCRGATVGGGRLH